jgi:hypothetical protein
MFMQRFSGGGPRPIGGPVPRGPLTPGGGQFDDGQRAVASPIPARGMQMFKRGGKVKKTGLAKVHKGERVLTKKQAARYKTAKLSTLKHAK